MDYTLLKIAIGLIIIAACFGLAVLIKILKDRPTPKLVVLTHGAFAATALILVILFALKNPQHAPIISLIIFIIAAIGGFTLLAYDLGGKRIPKVLAVLHPSIAVLGLISLIVFVVT